MLDDFRFDSINVQWTFLIRDAGSIQCHAILCVSEENRRDMIQLTVASR
jgi:hypothetical protein